VRCRNAATHKLWGPGGRRQQPVPAILRHLPRSPDGAPPAGPHRAFCSRFPARFFAPRNHRRNHRGELPRPRLQALRSTAPRPIRRPRLPDTCITRRPRQTPRRHAPTCRPHSRFGIRKCESSPLPRARLHLVPNPLPTLQQCVRGLLLPGQRSVHNTRPRSSPRGSRGVVDPVRLSPRRLHVRSRLASPHSRWLGLPARVPRRPRLAAAVCADGELARVWHIAPRARRRSVGHPRAQHRAGNARSHAVRDLPRAHVCDRCRSQGEAPPPRVRLLAVLGGTAEPPPAAGRTARCWQDDAGHAAAHRRSHRADRPIRGGVRPERRPVRRDPRSRAPARPQSAQHRAPEPHRPGAAASAGTRCAAVSNAPKRWRSRRRS
jgi:hypothetical protein